MKNMMEKVKRPKPTMSVEDQDLPQIKDWEVGKTYTVKAKIKMTYQSEGDEWESPDGQSKNVMRARFRILDIKPMKEEKSSKKPLPRVKE